MKAPDLDRFVEAQRGVHERARSELEAGRKTSHWMWFIFPQLAGLGASPTAIHYGIRSLVEARAYAAHPLLGPRLREMAAIAASLRGLTAGQVFGYPDDLKFRSSMTLFEAADPGETVYGEALEALCGGQRDQRTLRLLSGRRSEP
jgi:uncharacterized protein (DUF1810 family)